MQMQVKLKGLFFSMQVLSEYQDAGDIPAYVSSRYRSNIRRYSSNADDEIFAYRHQTDYDAYAKDIGLVSFYFENPTVFQYKRQSRMNGVGFLSQVHTTGLALRGWSFTQNRVKRIIRAVTFHFLENLQYNVTNKQEIA